MEEGVGIAISDPNSEFVAKYPNGLTLDDLIPFYEDVAENMPILLDWKFPGRIQRPSSQDLKTKKDDASAGFEHPDKRPDEIEAASKGQQQLNFDEFDFDTETSAAAADTAALAAAQRKPLGGSARSVREKRVARLDKILQEDLVRRRIELEQLRQQHQHQVQSAENIQLSREVTTEQSASNEAETAVSQPLQLSPHPQTRETNDGNSAPTDLPTEISELEITNK